MSVILDFCAIVTEKELIRVGVLADDFDIEVHTDTSKLERDYGYRSATDLREGLRNEYSA